MKSKIREDVTVTGTGPVKCVNDYYFAKVKVSSYNKHEIVQGSK
jgi:hypothetical protein